MGTKSKVVWLHSPLRVGDVIERLKAPFAIEMYEMHGFGKKQPDIDYTTGVMRHSRLTEFNQVRGNVYDSHFELYQPYPVRGDFTPKEDGTGIRIEIPKKTVPEAFLVAVAVTFSAFAYSIWNFKTVTSMIAVSAFYAALHVFKEVNTRRRQKAHIDRIMQFLFIKLEAFPVIHNERIHDQSYQAKK
jgi:hypothetical protein